MCLRFRMFKVGDRVKFKRESVPHSFGIDNGKVIEIADSRYKIESKINDVVIYRPRNKLSKIIMICAGIF